MIRYGLGQMKEINRCLFQLRSRSEDITGYLQMLIGEMSEDILFMELFPGEKICETLIQIKTQALQLDDKISSMERIHKELTRMYQNLEKKHRSGFEHIRKSMNAAIFQFNKKSTDKASSMSEMIMLQEEGILAHAVLTGKPIPANRSSLGRIQYILKEQYHYREAGRNELDSQK